MLDYAVVVKLDHYNYLRPRPTVAASQPIQPLHPLVYLVFDLLDFHVRGNRLVADAGGHGSGRLMAFLRLRSSVQLGFLFADAGRSETTGLSAAARAGRTGGAFFAAIATKFTVGRKTLPHGPLPVVSATIWRATP